MRCTHGCSSPTCRRVSPGPRYASSLGSRRLSAGYYRLAPTTAATNAPTLRNTSSSRDESSSVAVLFPSDDPAARNVLVLPVVPMHTCRRPKDSPLADSPGMDHGQTLSHVYHSSLTEGRLPQKSHRDCASPVMRLPTVTLVHSYDVVTIHARTLMRPVGYFHIASLHRLCHEAIERQQSASYLPTQSSPHRRIARTSIIGITFFDGTD
jgi:hypothetical protein